MPRITHAQLVSEAVAAMNEGDYQIAAELFRAALPLRVAENIEDPSADDTMGVDACISCNRPMRKRIVFGCRRCGTKQESRSCEACFAKEANRCSACGGPMGPVAPTVAYITADQVRLAMPGDDDYVDPSVGLNEYLPPTVTDPEEERRLMEEERSRKEIEDLMRPGTTRYDPEDPEDTAEVSEEDATMRSRVDLPGLVNRQMERDWRTNPLELPAVDPGDEQRQLMMDVIRKIMQRNVRPSLLRRLEEKTREHGTPLVPVEEEGGRWRAREVPRASGTGVPGGDIGDIGSIMEFSSVVYPTAEQIRTAAKLRYETRKEMRNKSFACPDTHPKVKDDKDHFPIHDLAHGRNAMARVNQYGSAPPWWGGSLAELKNTVSRAVHSRYPALAERTEKKG